MLMLRSKSVRLALCLFLLPLVMVFSTPVTASAATSEAIAVTLDTSGGPDWSCKLGAALQPGNGDAYNIVIGAGGHCHQPYVPNTPGLCNSGDADCSTFSITFKDQVEQTCAAGTLEVTSSSGWASKTSNFGALQMSGNPACDPVTVCIDAVFSPAGPDSEAHGCTGSSLDPPEDPAPPGCTNGGQAVRPTITAPVQQGPNTSGEYWSTREIGGAITLPAGNTFTHVHMYYVFRNAAYGAEPQVHGVTGEDVNVIVWSQPVTAGVAPSFPVMSYQTQRNTGDLASIQAGMADDVLLGAGYLATYGSQSWSSKPRALIRGPFGGNSMQGFVGVTDSDECSFYWGTKIASDNSTTYDEPVGPMEEGAGGGGTPEVVDPPAVDPPPADTVDPPNPFSWLAALLQKLIDAVMGLVGAIMDGLKALFVPSDGYMDDRLDRLSTSWDDTAPVKWADAVEGIALGSSSGCSGLPLDVSLPGGVQVDENLGAACSGSMANIAAIVRGVLSVVVVIGGLMACVRAVGSGLGWNPGVGRGAA